MEKQYRFWINKSDKELGQFLDNQQNISKFLKELINAFRLGRLSKTSNDDLKRKKLEVDIQFKEVMIKLKEKELLYDNTFGNTPSYSAKKAMKINVENQIPDTLSCFDEKNHRIMCPECGSCFVFALDQKDVQQAKEFFIDHYVKKHSLRFPEQLQEELKSF